MKYEIIRKIGDGGEGRVYLVRDRVLDKTWAMKVVPWTGKKGVMGEDLPFPVQVMKNFDHPLLPRLVDLFFRPPFLCLVMDYIPGRSLEDLVKEEGPQDRELVLSWARDLLSILSYLHQQDPPVYYQDLKPANILLTKEGTIKLIDFGAIFSPQGRGQGGGRRGRGTPGYAAPELYGGGEVGPWTDLYSLGMTLFFLLTGEDPGSGDGLSSTEKKGEGPQGRLEMVIGRATQTLPRNRYPSCQDMMEDLEGRERPEKARRRALVGGLILLVFLGLLPWGQNVHQNFVYRRKIQEGVEGAILEAIKMRPDRPEAYRVLLDLYRKDGRLDDRESQVLEILSHSYAGEGGEDLVDRLKRISEEGELTFFQKRLLDLWKEEEAGVGAEEGE
ncbi:MAG: serine/threonine-protein kinase [Firmicutes bacterium]|nr:serine/threonine-protein kinase [Bacillota bacterium]